MEQRIAPRNQAGKESLQIPLNLRVGVLLNQQGRRCVAHVQRQQSLGDPTVLYPGSDFTGEIVQAPSAGAQGEFPDCLLDLSPPESPF